jgi:hypothetical protein
VSKHETGWSDWLPFPEPRKRGILCAPFGPGAYELRHKSSEQPILFGQSKNVAFRMSSLLAKSLGVGTRKSKDKKDDVLEHLDDVEYRTIATASVDEAVAIENVLKKSKQTYKHNT